MTRSALLMGLSALALSALALPAHANSPVGSAKAGLVDLTQLNLIVIADMSAGADVEGKSFIGGNLSNANTMGIGTSANKGQGFAPSSFPTLTVGGNVSGNLNLNNGLNGNTPAAITPYGATVGGDFGGNFNLNSNGAPVVLTVGGSVGNFNASAGETITAGGAVNASGGHANGAVINDNKGPAFAAATKAAIAAQTSTFVSDLKSLSLALNTLNGGVSTAGSGFNVTDVNNATFTAVKDGNLGYAVIDITADQLAAARNLDFNLTKVGTGFLTTVINVTGASNYDIQANSNSAALAPYVIWNFVGAKAINAEREIDGSVLAPTAILHNSTQINGAVAAYAFNQAGEVHLGTFAGNSALTRAINGAVPEPATWVMMIGGLGLIGASLRRRRALSLTVAAA